MILSIEFTSEYIYLAETNPTGNAIRVDAFVKVPMPEGAYANGIVVNTASAASAIMAAVKEHRFHSKKAMVLVGGTDVIHKELTIPMGNKRQTREMVEHELERMGLIRPEYIFDYRIRKTKGEAPEEGKEGMQNVFACLVPKALVQNYTATIRRAGLTPYQMELANGSMERLAKILYLDKKEEMTILCCAEKDQVSFLFTGKGSKNVYRLVQIRQEDSLEENAFIVSAVQALTSVNAPEEKVVDAIVENVSKLVQFHLQTRGGIGVGEILLYGSMAGEDEFVSKIEAMSGIQTRKCPVPDCVDMGVDEEDASFLNIIGANAGMLQSVGELKRIDFFKSTKEKQKKHVTKKELMPLAIGLVVVGLAAMLYPILSAQNTKIINQTEDTKAYLEEPKRLEDYNARQKTVQYTSDMEVYNQTCDEYIKSIQETRRLTSLDLRAIEGKTGTTVQVTGYSFSEGVLTVDCVTASSNGAAAYVKQLTDEKYFEEVIYTGFSEGSDKAGQKTYSFSVDCVLWKGENVQS